MSNIDQTVTLASRVQASKNQISSDLADDVVILDLKGGVYHGLDGVGSRIWALLQVQRPVREIRDAILQEYDVEPEQCERDLLALLSDLVANGLLDVQPAPDQ